MTDTAAILASALQTDVETMRLLALNVANADSSGYRRAVPVTHATYDSIAESMSAAELAAAPLSPLTASVTTATDQSTGALRQTGNALDVALEGPGFLVIEGTNGPELTRRGDLKLDAAGFLVTHNGTRVMGERGSITASATPTISPDGVVRVQGEVIDRLRLIAVPAGTTLVSLGDDRYAAQGLSFDKPSGTLVRQGFVEGSNVQPVNEMVRVIETLRHFETTQRFVRAYDDMLKTGISELGKT